MFVEQIFIGPLESLEKVFMEQIFIGPLKPLEKVFREQLFFLMSSWVTFRTINWNLNVSSTQNMHGRQFIHSFIHYKHLYSAFSSGAAQRRNWFMVDDWLEQLVHGSRLVRVIGSW